jgi:cytoskeletal protein RodZ
VIGRGDELRRAREAQGLTLAQISEHLKIREHILDAIERDAPDGGPHAGQQVSQ